MRRLDLRLDLEAVNRRVLRGEKIATIAHELGIPPATLDYRWVQAGYHPHRSALREVPDVDFEITPALRQYLKAFDEALLNRRRGPRMNGMLDTIIKGLDD